uniref:Uncharacterized protein n=1 Tax=Arundo donax TaxID=35708 RepID=A0A0A9GVX2_ARUDO
MSWRRLDSHMVSTTQPGSDSLCNSTLY